jgi:hypothetical protein
MERIDLNCDMGELPEAIADGTQEKSRQDGGATGVWKG